MHNKVWINKYTICFYSYYLHSVVIPGKLPFTKVRTLDTFEQVWWGKKNHSKYWGAENDKNKTFF